MLVVWLTRQLRSLWWWVLGVTDETYTVRCGRCGANGRLHLLGGDCRRYVQTKGTAGD
jgi:hypothetical protein